MRLVDVYYIVQRWIWRRLKPRTRGVKVMLFDAAGRILLIRNTYGDSASFVLPGGGVGFFEKPEAAARREIKEELNCDVLGLSLISVLYSEREGKRDSVWLFKGETKDDPLGDPREVAEARYFSLQQLPEKVSPATRRRIAELKGEAARSSAW